MTSSIVTVHMATSADGFVARPDGGVDWINTADEFPDGETLDPAYVDEFLKGIDCYVMGSKTYELACSFAAQGQGWVYGDKPTFVLTHRRLDAIKPTVQFYAGELRELLGGVLRPQYKNIWVVGGGMVCGECVQLGLADEIRYSILPVAIGEGIRFFERLDRIVPLHLKEAKAYRSGMVSLRYEVKK